MRLIFCSDPLNPRQPDSAYAQEVAAERLGLDYSLINFEGLAEDAEAAVRRVAPAPEDGEIGVYRGWMMTTGQYAALFNALADRRVTLVNAPDQYEHSTTCPGGIRRWQGTRRAPCGHRRATLPCRG